MADPLIRQWHMLRLVPRAPRKASTAMLEDQLDERGFEINRRSIQRDLIKLSAHFPLVCDMRSKPYGWSWARDAAPFDVPGIDMHTALAFHLASEHLVHLLPSTTRSYLEPHVAHARAVLATLPGGPLADWPDKIAVVPSVQPRLPPDIDTEVLEAVHTALLKERQLDIVYRRRGEDETKRYRAHPHGLVYRDAVAYLVCTLWNYDDVVQLVVHRMARATVRQDKRRASTGFVLQDYVRSGAFGFLVGEAGVALKVRIESNVAASIIETPLSADQRSSTDGQGWTVVEATVTDTVALRTWLLGLSHYAEVLEPPSLRQEIIDATRQQAALYDVRRIRNSASIAKTPWQAYAETTYEVFDADRVVDLHVGERSRELDALLARHEAQSWAYLTAENPHSEPLSSAENATRNQALHEALKTAARAVYRGQGVGPEASWAPEQSFLAIGLDLAAALSLARAYDQAAFIFGRVGEAAQLIDSSTGAPRG